MQHKILLLLFVIITSCDSKREFDVYESIPNNEWNDPVNFNITIKDTVSPKNWIINIRNNKDYAYNNIFLIAKVKLPNGNKMIDTLEYEMADAQGRFLGSGYTDIKENKLLYQENKAFSQKGIYNITLEQAMRKMGEEFGVKALKGITDVGFRIEKTN